MREIGRAHADKWLNDPDNLSNRFAGNMHLTREEALRIHAEKFGPSTGGAKSSEGASPSTPGEVAAVPDSSTEKGAPSDDVVSDEDIEVVTRENMTPAEQAECAILAMQIGPTEAAQIMGVSESHATKLRNGQRGNDLVKDVVAETLEKVRGIAASKLNEAVSGIDTSRLKPTEATQVAVGLATVIEKVENRGKNQKGVAVVYRTAGRRTTEYEEVELRVGA